MRKKTKEIFGRDQNLKKRETWRRRKERHENLQSQLKLNASSLFNYQIT
uniref:Uncharacterized protein n=1 Tax=Rhizophora mucronata TaxID=61149 RepID=A0A2P2NZU0_RHIMU